MHHDYVAHDKVAEQASPQDWQYLAVAVVEAPRNLYVNTDYRTWHQIDCQFHFVAAIVLKIQHPSISKA